MLCVHSFFYILSLATIIGCSPHFQYNDVEIQCHCVLPQYCGDNDAAVNGQGLINPRYDNSLCPNFREICCEMPMEPEKGLPIVPQLPEFKKCGFGGGSDDTIPSRVTKNSKFAQFGELPWNVILVENVSYRCGGSLIHPKTVMTAAHCVSELIRDEMNIIVRAGEWNTKSKNEPLPHQEIKVQEIVIHPHYNKNSLKNDIALLFLTDSFILAENVGIVCLPSSNIDVVQDDCIASGWGKDTFRTGRYSSILKKVHLSIIAREKCLFDLRNTRLGKMYNLHRSFICAGGEKNKDTCEGDGGGPLICPVAEINQRFIQVGIVSWGIGCGAEDVPGVYVNVAQFVAWIDSQMADRDMDYSLYKI